MGVKNQIRSRKYDCLPTIQFSPSRQSRTFSFLTGKEKCLRIRSIVSGTAKEYWRRRPCQRKCTSAIRKVFALIKSVWSLLCSAPTVFKILVYWCLKGTGDFEIRQMSAVASLRNLHRSINTLIKIDVISLFIRSVGRYLNSIFLANGRAFYDPQTQQYLTLVLCCGILKKSLKIVWIQ